MAKVYLKEPHGWNTRTVTSVCTEGVRHEVTMDNHSVVIDEPPERGGLDQGAAPMMHFNAAFATCQSTQIVKVADAMRFKHGKVIVTVKTDNGRYEGQEKNSEILRFVSAEMTIDIETDEPPAKIERLKNLSIDRCPVGVMLDDAGVEQKVVWNILPMPH